MKNLLYKELILAKHPTNYIFLVFALLLLIPDYPYYVAFIYTCLGIFFIFLLGRENKDLIFTVSLPVRKRDIVKARCWMVAIIELVQIIVSIPFAIISVHLNSGMGGNSAGIEANVAFFGFVFIMFAVFNLFFFPLFYRTGYKIGIPLITGGIATCVYVVAIELAVQLVAPLKAALDTTEPAMMVQQIPVLVVGVVIFVFANIFAYKRSALNFEKVDL